MRMFLESNQPLASTLFLAALKNGLFAHTELIIWHIWWPYAVLHIDQVWRQEEKAVYIYKSIIFFFETQTAFVNSL